MNVLIVGASGLVGSNCLRHFSAVTDWNIVGTYFSYAAKDTVFLDTLNPDNEDNFDIAAFDPDVIVHCGALTHVDYCETHEEESYTKTVQSTKNIIRLCRKFNARMAFISSDYVFDGVHGPYDEQAPVHPLSIYGKHKLEAEQLVMDSFDDAILLRITNVYGDEERGKNFVARIISQILDGKRLTLKLPEDQFATPVNAMDVARSLRLLLQDGHHGLFHIASTDYMSRVQLSLRILAHFPEAGYDLEALRTDTMNQAAARPLQGGLKNHKFMRLYPDFRFSTVDDYVAGVASRTTNP